MLEKLLKFSSSEFAEGELRFTRVERPEWILLAFFVAAALAYLYYRRTPPQVPRSKRLLLTALRTIAIASILLFILHPVLRIKGPSGRHQFVTVLVDDSRSMSMSDAGESKLSRMASAKKLLFGEKEKADGLRPRMEELCPVKWFRFSADSDPLDKPAELKAQGPFTNLFRSMKHVNDDLQGISHAAMVICSDGAYNAGGPPHELARQMGTDGVPVFTIGVGDEKPPPDLEVAHVHAPKEVRQNSEVEAFAVVRAYGYTEPFEVLLKLKGEVIQKAVVTPPKDGGVTRVRLKFQPDAKGSFVYRVEIPAAKEEKITDNNHRDFMVRITDKRVPVLYVEGSPREEYRFIRRALYKDKDFRIAGILRTGGKEPLLQGLEPEDHIEKGYPTKIEDLLRFEAVIFGDIEAGYFTPEQIKMTEEFVREKGRGFLMLGGVNSLNLGSYKGTPFEGMLPVVLEGPEVAYDNRELRLMPTPDGVIHPILHQYDDPVQNRTTWKDAPVLIGINPLKGVKPGALTLAKDSVKQLPLLAVQNYGAGRSAVFATGGSWRWRMSLPLEQELHEKFWKQLVRWLAVGSKPKIQIEVDKDIYMFGETVSVSTTVLGKQLEPINDAEVVAKVTDPFGKTTEYRQEWILSQEGVYQTQFKLEAEGEYTAVAQAKFKDGTEETASTTFSVGETYAEFNELAQKGDVLREISRVSGGQYFTPEKAGDLIEVLKKILAAKKDDEKVVDDKDLWDAPLCFGVVALALLLEWLLRRTTGLA